MPIVLNGSGPITGVTSLNTTVSDTEIGYLDGVTSALQTQINSKANDSAVGLVKIVASSFSAVTSVNVNDCFSSTYDNYRITLRVDPLASGNQVIDWRLRVSGADNTSASYGYTTNYGYIQLATSGFEVNLGNTSTAFGRFLAHSTTGGGAGYVDIFSPNLTAQTLAVGNSIEFDSNAGAVRMTKGWRFSGTTSFTGFSLLSSSNMTGLVTVYGFQK